MSSSESQSSSEYTQSNNQDSMSKLDKYDVSAIGHGNR